MIEQKFSCGTCRACCVNLTILTGEDPEESRKVKTWVSSGEEEKPAGVPCPQLNPRQMKFGCSIHSNPDKPSVCSTYLCSYAIGVFGNNPLLRPDNLGIIVDIYEGRVRITEIEKTALNRQLTKKVLWKLQQIASSKEGEWKMEIIPFELMGTKLGVETPIIPASKLSIGGKK